MNTRLPVAACLSRAGVAPALRSRRRGRPSRSASSCRIRPAARPTSSRARSAQKLGDALGQTIVVENKPGANGNVGADFVAKVAARRLHVPARGHRRDRHQPERVPDAAVRSGEGLHAGHDGRVLAAHPRRASGRAGAVVAELVALAKSKPGKLNYAASSTGSAPHLAGVEFAQRAKVDWAYIPYKGGAQAITDVVGGQADLLFNGMLATYPQVKGGKLRILAVSSAKRLSLDPGRADRRRERLSGIRDRIVAGHPRAAGNAAADRRQARQAKCRRSSPRRRSRRSSRRRVPTCA